MTIAICDDETEIRELLKNKIETVYPEEDVILYRTGEELLASKKQMDLLFLDIQMPGLNGMEVAKILRKDNQKIILIFVTALEEYVFEAFDVDAFHYLVKPFSDKKFYMVMEKARRQYQELCRMRQVQQQEEKSKSLLIKTRGICTRVFLRDIIYAEVFNRKIVLHTVMAGYFSFTFFSDVYLAGTDQYIWNVHREYWWIKVMYQLISFAAILLSIMVYQKIKSIHKKEKEDAILQEQMENMRGHIAEVEARYLEIRRLKHDMGNHVVMLENLVMKKETQQAENYLASLKGELQEITGGEHSGNPVVDAIFTESRKRAEEKGIHFISAFHYPGGTVVNAFDISVILNNAINNAIEGCEGVRHPHIHLVSYREKNVYMIECRNRFTGEIFLDEESGLPVTSKKDREWHGYGIISIRKVAQKYHGDVDICLENGTFILSVMLMLDE